jgi:inorganic pyrophosphatase
MENLWNKLETGPKPPETIYAIIQTPMGSKNRYVYNAGEGAFFLEKVLVDPFKYAADHGIIPKTLYDDGNPLEVILLADEPTFPGCVVEAKPIGLLRLMEGDRYDDKVVAVPIEDHKYKDITDVKHIYRDTLNELALFFQHYKDAEGIKVKVVGWEGQEKAHKAIVHSMKLYGRKKGVSGSES